MSRALKWRFQTNCLSQVIFWCFWHFASIIYLWSFLVISWLNKQLNEQTLQRQQTFSTNSHTSTNQNSRIQYQPMNTNLVRRFPLSPLTLYLPQHNGWWFFNEILQVEIFYHSMENSEKKAPAPTIVRDTGVPLVNVKIWQNSY